MDNASNLRMDLGLCRIVFVFFFASHTFHLSLHLRSNYLGKLLYFLGRLPRGLNFLAAFSDLVRSFGLSTYRAFPRQFTKGN